jgi:outer membrane protein assembly factor BamB
LSCLGNPIGFRRVGAINLGYKKKVIAESGAPSNGNWTGWRGPQRDGHVAWLPDSLPSNPRPIWKKRLRSPGVGGLAATDKYVIVSDREARDTADAFRCLDAKSGDELWKISYPAKGDLDYGSSPRATPLIHGDHVYLLGAFGHLHCVNLSTGEIVWKKDIRKEFQVTTKMVWGHSSSPLVIEDKLIINPGSAEASVVALSPLTGKVLWKSPGEAAAFASFVLARVDDQTELIGYDATSISGRDPTDGRRIWEHTPPRPNDFNVPTPLLYENRLVLATENNGTRLFRFSPEKTLDEQPIAVNEDLAPDTHTPIIVGDRLFGVWNELFCLDLKNNLKPLWTADASTFQNYVSMIASSDKVLITGIHGEALLIDALADTYKLISQAQLIEEDSGVFSHPAIVGNRLYIRGSSDIRCFVLD